MTRVEFLNNTTLWWELINFCSDVECDICEEIYDDGTIDGLISEDIDYLRESEPWYFIGQKLAEFCSGYEYYCRGNPLEYTPMDDDDTFEEYKGLVLSWADTKGVFDDDDDDDDDDVSDCISEFIPSVDEIFSLFESI